MWVMAAAAGADPDPAPRVRLPMRVAERPTTVPADHFGVRFLGGLERGAGERWRGPLRAEAGYGVDDRLEVGVRLLRLVLADADDPMGGLLAPRVYGRVRVTLGPVEVGTLADLELPFEGFRAADLGGFARVHLGRWAAIDVEGESGVRTEPNLRWPGGLSARLVLSMADRLSLVGGARLDTEDLGEPKDGAARPLAGVVLTVGTRGAPPLTDIGLWGWGPPLALGSAEPDPTARVELRIVLWFDDPNPPDPTAGW